MSRPRDRPAQLARNRTGAWWTATRIGPLVVERYANVCLLHDPTARGETERRGRVLRRLAVALAEDDPYAVPLVMIAPLLGAQGDDLADGVQGWLHELAREQGASQLRLVVEIAPGATDSVRSALHRFTDATGIRLLVPSGRLLEVPGDTLFPVAETGAGTWQRFVPGHDRPLPVGPWSFTAQWHTDLGLLPPIGLVPGLRAVPVPAGVLLLAEDEPAPGWDDVVYSVPVDPRRPLVMVLQSNDFPLSADRIAEYLMALPGQVRGLVRFAATGDLALTPDWQEIAETLEEEITVLTGLPLDVGGEPVVSVVSVTDDGEPLVRWRPPATHLLHTPSYGAGPRPARVVGVQSLSWPPELEAVAGGDDPNCPNIYSLKGSWEVEVVPCGFLLRRSIGRVDDPPSGMVVFDPDGPVVVDRSLGAQGSSDLVRSIQEIALRVCGRPARIESEPTAAVIDPTAARAI